MTGILTVSSYDVYALIDPGSTLSYITPYITGRIGITPEPIKPFEVSTPVGDPVLAKQVYRGCIVVVCGQHTVADLIELKMLDFDVIMGMDYRAKVVRFQFPGGPVLEWKGNTASPRGRFISYLKARKMIAKGYIYHLVRVHDTEAKPPTLRQFRDVAS